jgi:cytochrome c-type biogenesis protein CcmE
MANLLPRGVSLDILVVVGGITTLALKAWRAIWFFFSPLQIVVKEASERRTFRLGALVVAGWVERDGVAVRFEVTDPATTVPVQFWGVAPTFLYEANAWSHRTLWKTVYSAQKEVLAKHDENYAPPEAAEASKNAAKSNDKTAISLVASPSI